MFNLFNMFKPKEKAEQPLWYNHAPQDVKVGDTRKFRLPSEACYDIVTPDGTYLAVIDSLKVLSIDGEWCNCLVDWVYGEKQEKKFHLGYLKGGTLYTTREN